METEYIGLTEKKYKIPSVIKKNLFKSKDSLEDMLFFKFVELIYNKVDNPTPQVFKLIKKRGKRIVFVLSEKDFPDVNIPFTFISQHLIYYFHEGIQSSHPDLNSVLFFPEYDSEKKVINIVVVNERKRCLC
jgi:hypothetical protein